MRYLSNSWYVAAFADELPPGGRLGRTLLGEDIVLFRTEQGTVAALRGRCPPSNSSAFFDLERIEALKGPQGTLYGRNATGGAINMIPRRPKLSEFGGEAGIEIGNYNLVKADAAINVPIGAVAALRAAAQSVDRDGYYSDGGGDEDNTAARVQLLLKPNDTLSFNLNADYAKQGGIGPGGASLSGAIASVGGPSVAPGFVLSDRVGAADPRLIPFYWDYTNQQFSHLTFDSAGSVVFATENVGAVDIKGLELESQYLVTRNTLLNAQIQYLDAKYDEFRYVQPFIPPTTSCAIGGGPIFAVDCGGRRPPLTPEWSINLGLQQTIPLSNGAAVVADLRTHYQSSAQTTVDDVPLGVQDAYWVSDASLSYTSPSDAWSFTAFVNNSSDETILATTFRDPFSGVVGSPLYFGQIQAPRTYGARVRVKF